MNSMMPKRNKIMLMLLQLIQRRGQKDKRQTCQSVAEFLSRKLRKMIRGIFSWLSSRKDGCTHKNINLSCPLLELARRLPTLPINIFVYLATKF